MAGILYLRGYYQPARSVRLGHSWTLRLVLALFLGYFCNANISTAADVNIYASHPKDARKLIGNHENTEVGDFLRDYLDLDLEPITKELLEKGSSFDTFSADGSRESWLGKPIPETKVVDKMDHYHGDFKRSLDCNH